ncbi:MAG: hypothetical protein PHH17_01200 [Candidatus Pacebacteria bacterium]|nr:hypothetical protein [Candidatus Paceibacterota bacterium]MDD3728943.1 hypothetical protein [Candidatus Paceibacterota bacterium]MDD4201559.1 hypothetical protein [Candidatus Paceibacterota bacterium]MDD5445812.1 hypothetical protein [Candidatus Paceibacterota bacterium]
MDKTSDWMTLLEHINNEINEVRRFFGEEVDDNEDLDPQVKRLMDIPDKLLKKHYSLLEEKAINCEDILVPQPGDIFTSRLHDFVSYAMLRFIAKKIKEKNPQISLSEARTNECSPYIRIAIKLAYVQGLKHGVNL